MLEGNNGICLSSIIQILVEFKPQPTDKRILGNAVSRSLGCPYLQVSLEGNRGECYQKKEKEKKISTQSNDDVYQDYI